MRCWRWSDAPMEGLPLAFDPPPPPVARDDALQLSFESWEGPLDLLLALARNQKVDLREISILALVEQYLHFIAEARELKLEVAADYLVMAAWLAYLKSALLLPKDPLEEPSPDELALRLQLRLQRLAAMREAAARLLARDRLGRDVFLRPRPEGLRDVKRRRWDASLYDILAAYGQVKLRSEPVVHMVSRRPVITLDAALHHLERMLGVKLDWGELADFLPADYQGLLRRSAIASSFVAALELARQGRVELKQGGAFEPLYLRAAGGGGA
ncbi:condensin subunit ScpA [Sphingopyxis alaskensis RB2256]|uniref:Segregation and condensation protein A n=2 Tax=Sphingopyxis alaskensis TaxID=117207 RepID=Q1GU15_SPHAL|nr:condensin subunit ScpA [Sphingopyxis alaskensis RB2256]